MKPETRNPKPEANPNVEIRRAAPLSRLFSAFGLRDSDFGLPAGVIAVWLAGAVALSAQTPTAEQIKSQLIGQTMGGRQRCWKFQSAEQIKELTLTATTEDARRCVCIIALRLQATNSPAQYMAQARVQYTRTAAGWSFNHVGLLSLKMIK